MAPTWLDWNNYLYVPEQSVTRGDKTYTVAEHYDWNKSIYIEGLKYKPSVWKDRETGNNINIYSEYF